MEYKTNFENLLGLIEDIQTNKESYLKASKQVRDSIIQINEDFKKSLTEINQNFSNTFNDLQKDVFKNFEVFKSYNFQKNLFSEEAIKSFKEIYRFEDDIVFQAQQTIRDLYINPTAISTLTETINSTYPIKNFQNKANDNKFKKMFLDKNSLPYNGYVKKSGHFVITTDAGNFLTNFINDNSLNVERSLIFVVVALLMYLYSFYPYYKN